VPTPLAAEIVLTAEERMELKGWARIVLAAADGGTNTELAERLGLSISTVRRWRNRFVVDRCDGLLDEPRPGRPRVVGNEHPTIPPQR
jgi:transposase